MGACYDHLTYLEHLSVWNGVRDGLSIRAIARMLNRAPSTISRLIERNQRHGRVYDGPSAFFRSLWIRKQSRLPKLRPGVALFETVTAYLRQGWSPQQIAGRLRRMEADNLSQRVCHETIYVALYALPRGELRRELLACLRQERQKRRPRSRGQDRRSFVPEELRIAARPQDIAERLIPGHWEGDLIKGASNRSAVGTLVERKTRLVMIARMDGLDAAAAQKAFENLFNQVPQDLRKTMTYDRGTEMARHAELTKNTGVKVYFADPYSPWQRGANENTNGLIRQYLPKGIDLTPYSQNDLDEIAHRLNSRPRKVLDFQTPNEVYHQVLQKLPKTIALQN